MSLGTYSELKTSIETWLARSDTGITNNASDFVTLAESRLNRMLPLHINRVDLAMSCAASSRNPTTFPIDFYEPIALYLTTFGVSTTLQPFVAGTMEYGLVNQIPTGWCISSSGSALRIDLDSPCDQTHTFSFRYRKSFQLSDSSTTNWLLTNHPDAYLSASLVEACTMLGYTEDAALWQGRLNLAIEEILDKEARLVSSAPLMTDTPLTGRRFFNFTAGL